MKAIDIVKPKTDDPIENSIRILNWGQSQILAPIGKKIKVDEQEPCEFCAQSAGTSLHGNVCNNCAEENYNDGNGDFNGYKRRD